VLAATTIGTNIVTGGSIYATSTLYVDGASTFTAALTLATASSTGTVKFPVIDSDTDTIELAANASTTGTAILKSASIKSDTGAISFDNENLTTTGSVSAGTAAITSQLTVNGYATTTAAGVVGPGRYVTGATPTCGAAQEGGFLWNSTKKKTCVCDGSSWVEATSTATTACF